jgi:Holliday junction resolvase
MPLYYSKDDKKTETLVRKALEVMGWEARVTDIPSRWDIEAYKDGRTAIVEVKRRRMEWGRYPTVFIDKSKVEALCDRASQAKEGEPILVIVPNDMVPRFARLANAISWKTNTINVRPERRDRSDENDLKYEIPIDQFRPLIQF